MNHLFNLKPSAITIVDKQRIAQHRLVKDKTTRTPTELAHYQRSLAPVPLADVELPRLILAQRKNDASKTYVVVGEVAQNPGSVILVDLLTGAAVREDANEFELVPPAIT